ncbi:MAG TPA: topoisomerase [Thermoplasmata archaeon]|jgi:5S rRNA maturation endonuclease (ribonuclease M5)|nr:MAG TPA: topoisomerase [Thermoplasmata archaeon]
MNDQEALDELEETLAELRQENTTVPIIVEGAKDAAALRILEMPGEVIRFNKGQSVSDFCDMVASSHQRIILLTDWDWRGGRLCLSIKKHLENRVGCIVKYREVFAKRCPCRTVEGMPTWLQTLRKKVQGE